VTTAAPLLFLDVDGPLNPYAAKPERRPQGHVTLRVPGGGRRPLRLWLAPAHGPALLGLGYELCWATSWMADANRWIAPVLGLPELPFVDFGEALFRERPDGVHRKTKGHSSSTPPGGPSSGSTTSRASGTRRT
jgi:hypothetical protein